ncbi:ATP-binding protein [Coprobacter sp.]
MGCSSGGVAGEQQDKDQVRLDHKLKDEDVRAILKDPEGYMWIGSRNGLFKLKATTHIPKENAVPQQYKHITNDPNSLPGNWITSLYLDSSQTLWIGTSSGLCIYDSENDNFIKQELPSGNRAPYISGIIEDNYKTVWVITTGGIYQLTKKKNIQYFELANGNFASINYAYGACKDKNGMVYLGGVTGLTYFNPLEITPDSTINPVYISDLKSAGDMAIETNENINRMKKIILDHHYSQFSFEFSSLYYANPYRIKYSYMLEGIDKNWIYSDARNYVTYTNIPPGKYIFKIRSTNPTGFWQDNTKDIEINILPPPWKTWWAYTLYVLAAIALGWTAFRFFMERERLLRSEEMNQWKLKFYTNITHGFKAPLSLMESPLQTLLRNRERMSSSEIQDMLEIMKRNMKRLSHLINQLLEFRKIDRGKSTLELVETDIITLLSDVYESFYSLSKSKGITFHFKTDINSLRVTFDFEKIETVLFNLLSNAFKFTNKGGEITLSCNLDPNGSKIWISVSDTGVGIDSRHQQKIFERFWQVDSNHSALLKGTGIGLSLANDFVELHKGKISVESKLGKGSTFRFFLWMGNKHFNDQIICKIKNNEERHADYVNNFIEIEENLTEHESDTPEKEDNRPLIFVIDDDKDHLEYISRMLKHDYQIETFTDCSTVFNEITRKNPTLIISDVMIGNEEQGFKLCKQIKNDLATSHIPIILLTGLVSEKDKLSGYEMGADAYVEKPFNGEYLQVRIKQLLNAREKFKEKIKMDIIINPKDISATSTDEKFLVNVMSVIEENIEDENFSLDDFARKMNISRSILNNKLQSLTNQTPIEFVRNIRLKRAAQLLTLNAYTVSEISFKVGISAPRYFSTIFKKQFGMTPKEYARKYGKEKNELDNTYDNE